MKAVDASAPEAVEVLIARAGWAAQPPEAPAEIVGAIAPTPLLLVHGDADRYFPLAHVRALAAAAPSAQVWIEPGLGHAETAMTPALLGRIADWVAQCLVPVPGSVCDDDRRD